ncbi:MAG: hypothetical protein MUE94_11535 [Verrucomicrobia bacterium]|jgi:hypothetical protein|nr:hypothetical protein [Verrucomicrobiota bacterium]
MGLTIHYQLRPADSDEGVEDLQARWAVEELRKLALKFKRQGRVTAVGGMDFTPDLRRFAIEWRTRPVPGRPHAFTSEEIRPLTGHLFHVGVGRGCEPLLLGLCCYPRGGWRLKGFCKTQYASLYGWDHFQRCHTAVIDLLAGARPLGFRVRINDEGDYWPRRSLKALRANLEEMNAVVAAAAGVLKDAAEAGGSPGVQSPIFEHPQFERIEAEGDARGHASRLRKLLR